MEKDEWRVSGWVELRNIRGMDDGFSWEKCLWKTVEMGIFTRIGSFVG